MEITDLEQCMSESDAGRAIPNLHEKTIKSFCGVWVNGFATDI